MARWFPLLLLLTALTPLTPIAPAQDKDKPTRTVVTFDVEAKAAPKPALKYQLLPELREIESGTALQHYLKCFMEQNHFYNAKESVADREKWQAMPLKDLPVEKLRNYGGKSLRFADAAARMDRIEWQILAELRREGVNTLLPEIQQLRTLAAALKVRLRGEVADKRFDEAIRTIKTLFRLGQQLGEHPTLIGNLVGMAIVALTTTCVEEMIQQPGCPNLYWALADLPSPLVSLRTGAQGERMFFLKELGRLERTAPASEENVEKAVAGFEVLMRDLGEKRAVDVRAYLKERAGDKKAVEQARERLIEGGVKKAVAEKMSATQIILLDEQLAFEILHDDMTKWMTQPFWRAEPKYLELAKKKGGMLTELAPNVRTVHRAQSRIEQRLKLLQVLEGIRLHAAANKGAVPAKLEDVEVPLPDDPYTGKAFRYSVKDGKATLSGTPPRGEEKTAAYNVTYEIQIKK